MSDVQSVTSAEWSTTGTTLVKLVNINVVLKKVLQSLDPEERTKIVLRCDDLPMAVGDETHFTHLFRSLLQMILQKKEEVQTLFLHISCTACNEIQAAKSATGLYLVQFNSNIIPCSSWFKKNQELLSELSAMVAQNKGSLAVNQFKASGCIFSVSLPGKAV